MMTYTDLAQRAAQMRQGHRADKLRKNTQGVLRSLRHVWRELRGSDALVYTVTEGQLSLGGGPFRLHYLGRKRFANDFLIYFERHGDTPAVTQTFSVTGSYVSFVRTRARLRRCPVDADMLIVDRLFSRDADDAPFTLMAPFLNAFLPVEADFATQLGKVRSKGHRRKLQSAVKRDFTWRQTRDMADFELWYDTMYTPFVQLRFGGDASVVGKDDMRAMYLKSGFLLLLEEAGEPVSGSFMYTTQNMPGTLAYWKYALKDAANLSPNAFGERNAKTEAMVLSFASQEKYKEIDFGLTRALPKDGIFTHKKRLGCDFRVPTQAPKFAVLLAEEARVRFLQGHPLVVLEQGALHAWAAHEGELGPNNKGALEDTLSACGFASLQSIQLFARGVAASRDVLGTVAVQAGVDLNCRVDLVEDTTFTA